MVDVVMAVHPELHLFVLKKDAKNVCDTAPANYKWGFSSTYRGYNPRYQSKRHL